MVARRGRGARQDPNSCRRGLKWRQGGRACLLHPLRDVRQRRASRRARLACVGARAGERRGRGAGGRPGGTARGLKTAMWWEERTRPGPAHRCPPAPSGPRPQGLWVVWRDMRSERGQGTHAAHGCLQSSSGKRSSAATSHQLCAPGVVAVMPASLAAAASAPGVSGEPAARCARVRMPVTGFTFSLSAHTLKRPEVDGVTLAASEGSITQRGRGRQRWWIERFSNNGSHGHTYMCHIARGQLVPPWSPHIVGGCRFGDTAPASRRGRSSRQSCTDGFLPRRPRSLASAASRLSGCTAGMRVSAGGVSVIRRVAIAHAACAQLSGFERPLTALSLLPRAVSTRTLAGAGVAGATDGVAAGALFNTPSGLAFAPSTLFPSSAGLGAQGTLWVADTGNHRLRRVDVATGLVESLAGAGAAGYAEGDARTAQFSSPRGVAVTANGTVFVAGACLAHAAGARTEQRPRSPHPSVLSSVQTRATFACAPFGPPTRARAQRAGSAPRRAAGRQASWTESPLAAPSPRRRGWRGVRRCRCCTSRTTRLCGRCVHHFRVMCCV